MEPNIRRYAVRLFKLGETVCFYKANYFIPPTVPRINELIGLDLKNDKYRQYKVISVCYDFPNYDDDFIMLIDITVDEIDNSDEKVMEAVNGEPE